MKKDVKILAKCINKRRASSRVKTPL